MLKIEYLSGKIKQIKIVCMISGLLLQITTVFSHDQPLYTLHPNGGIYEEICIFPRPISLSCDRSVCTFYQSNK